MYLHMGGPCTRAVKTAVYTGRKDGRVQGTRPCIGYTTVYTVYTVVYPVHGRVCGRSRRVRAVYTTTQCIPGIAKVDSRNLLEGYYSNPIIRSLEIDLFTFSVAVTFWVTM